MAGLGVYSLIVGDAPKSAPKNQCPYVLPGEMPLAA